MIIFKDKPILKMYNEYRNDQKTNGSVHYVDLWRKKNIYRN